MPFNQEFTVHTKGAGLHDITREVQALVGEARVDNGLCTIFIRHTSASLLIQENADPDVQRDLEAWLDRLVPENDPLYTHTIEGPDDMPAHIKSALTLTSLWFPSLAQLSPSEHGREYTSGSIADGHSRAESSCTLSKEAPELRS